MSEPNERSINQGHEPVSIPVRRVVLWGGGGVLALLAGSSLLLYVMITRWTEPEPPRWTPVPDLVAPRTEGPLVYTRQPQQLQRLREWEQLRLSRYEWLDKEAGVARIPIERAMSIVLETGLPEYELLDSQAGAEASPEENEPEQPEVRK